MLKDRYENFEKFKEFNIIICLKNNKCLFSKYNRK